MLRWVILIYIGIVTKFGFSRYRYFTIYKNYFYLKICLIRKGKKGSNTTRTIQVRTHNSHKPHLGLSAINVWIFVSRLEPTGTRWYLGPDVVGSSRRGMRYRTRAVVS